MRIEHNHNWLEITEKEYNKHILVIPENTTPEKAFALMFCYISKEIVRREIIMPDDICGIFNVCDYLESDCPKKYRYFKSVGKRIDYIVSSDEYESLKDNQFFKNL